MAKKGKKQRIPSAARNNSILKGVSESNSAKAAEQKLEDDFLLSFKYLDREQGQTLEQWEQDGILARAFDKLRNYCCNTLKSHIGNGLEIYGGFPKNSDFDKPKHVPEDAEWARIHVTGTQIVAGFVNRNVFNVVFLDKNHRFYIVEKNTLKFFTFNIEVMRCKYNKTITVRTSC